MSVTEQSRRAATELAQMVGLLVKKAQELAEVSQCEWCADALDEIGDWLEERQEEAATVARVGEAETT